jgi:hypothetical protein
VSTKLTEYSVQRKVMHGSEQAQHPEQHGEHAIVSFSIEMQQAFTSITMATAAVLLLLLPPLGSPLQLL